MPTNSHTPPQERSNACDPSAMGCQQEAESNSTLTQKSAEPGAAGQPPRPEGGLPEAWSHHMASDDDQAGWHRGHVPQDPC